MVIASRNQVKCIDPYHTCNIDKVIQVLVEMGKFNVVSSPLFTDLCGTGVALKNFISASRQRSCIQVYLWACLYAVSV